MLTLDNTRIEKMVIVQLERSYSGTHSTKETVGDIKAKGELETVDYRTI